MAYQSTTATSTADVMDKLRLFAIAQGWTINRWRDTPDSQANPNVGKELCIYHADCGYFNLYEEKWHYRGWALGGNGFLTHNHIVTEISTSFDSTKTTWEQPGSVAGEYFRCGDFVFSSDVTTSVKFFGTTQYIYMVAEHNGSHTHLLMGNIDKAWNYTGGQFLTITFWGKGVEGNAHHAVDWITPFRSNVDVITYIGPRRYRTKIKAMIMRCDLPGQSAPQWHTSTGSLLPGYGTGHDNVYSVNLFHNLPQTMNALSPLLPIVPAIISNDKTYLPGVFPDTRIIKMNFLDPGQELSLGSDTWACFPLVHKYITEPHFTVPSTGVFGIAYKK